jgi:hypothetical protein
MRRAGSLSALMFAFVALICGMLAVILSTRSGSRSD